MVILFLLLHFNKQLLNRSCKIKILIFTLLNKTPIVSVLTSFKGVSLTLWGTISKRISEISKFQNYFRLPVWATILQKTVLQNQLLLVEGFDPKKPNPYQKWIIFSFFISLCQAWKVRKESSSRGLNCRKFHKKIFRD